MKMKHTVQWSSHQDSSIKYGKLNCRKKIDSKFLQHAGFICDDGCDSSDNSIARFHDKNTPCNTKYTHSSSELWSLCTILKFKFQTATVRYILACLPVDYTYFCLGLKTDYQLLWNENQSGHYRLFHIYDCEYHSKHKLFCGSINIIQELPVLSRWIWPPLSCWPHRCANQTKLYWPTLWNIT
jgi:hypothetical protein